MNVVSKKAIINFCEAHADAKEALNQWYKTATKAKWHNLADLKRDFPSADYVGNDRYVFNIKGNKYRIVVLLFFPPQRAFIRFIGTHAEYDKINLRTV